MTNFCGWSGQRDLTSYSTALLRRGYRVYGTLRTAGKEGELSKHEEYTTLIMDVDSSESIRKAREKFLANETRLDLLICNAGFGGNHILMDLPEAEARAVSND